MHSIETEGKRLERMARVQRFALSPRSPTGSPKRHALKAPIHLTGLMLSAVLSRCRVSHAVLACSHAERLLADGRGMLSPRLPSSPAKNTHRHPSPDDLIASAPRAASPVTLLEESAGGSMNRAASKRTAAASLNFIPEPYDLLSPTHGTSNNISNAGPAASRGGMRVCVCVCVYT